MLNLENEYNKFKNGISADPINSQNEKNSLEDEYILELNMDEDDFKEILEEDNRECTELVKMLKKFEQYWWRNRLYNKNAKKKYI